MKFKRGDTFSFAGTASAVVNGVPTTDFTGWTIRSHIRNQKNKLVDTLVVAWVSAAAGTFSLAASGPTTTWPVETLSMDIEFTSPTGMVISTDTLTVIVGQDVTYD